MEMTPTVKQLLIINILFFLGTLFVGEETYNYLSLFYFENSKFQFWQVLSHMFMHGNFLHLAFNMFALYSFGSVLEHFWGGKKFLFFYVSCGLGAALLHTLVNFFLFRHGLNTLTEAGFSQTEILNLLNQGQLDTRWFDVISKSEMNDFTGSFASPAVGASGAIYGLLVAFAFMAPNAELALMFIPIPIKAKYFVPGLLCIDLFLGLKGNSIFGGASGIAHFAHIGGAIVGFLMMWYWKKNQFNDHRWN